MRRLLCALLLGASPLFAGAQSVPPADAEAVRKVIEAQLDAFRRDDAEGAFSYAAPAIREMVGTPERFIQMVKTSYAVVYRPHRVTFREPVKVGKDLAQPVRMTDEEGRAWVVVYPMERQPDGKWLINGCQLAPLKGQET
jgi:chlorite dismutase